MTPNLTVELLHKSCLFKIEHLQVRLDLNVLVVRHDAKKPLGSVLDLDQGLGAIGLLFDSVNLPDDPKRVSVNFAHVQVVERVIPDESNPLVVLNLVGRLVLRPRPVACVNLRTNKVGDLGLLGRRELFVSLNLRLGLYEDRLGLVRRLGMDGPCGIQSLPGIFGSGQGVVSPVILGLALEGPGPVLFPQLISDFIGGFVGVPPNDGRDLTCFQCDAHVFKNKNVDSK